MTGLLPERVRAAVKALAVTPDEPFPAYVTDLVGLRAHLRDIRAALPREVELFYAVKANPDRPVLETLGAFVDGFEIASGGELYHLYDLLPGARLAFGGPGKTEREIEMALKLGVDRFHVESVQELRLLAATADRLGADAQVLLRVNIPVPMSGVVLAMGGRPSPFGLDPDALDAALEVLRRSARVRLCGLHAHLASGPDAATLAHVARQIVGWGLAWARTHRAEIEEINLGGGMGVDYTAPAQRFDWTEYGAGLARLAADHADVRLRIEPGRALTAYCGYYASEVLDVKHSQGAAFAVLRGGTHHLRTPVTKAHDQPFAVIPVEGWPSPWPRAGIADEPVTLVGQLCTPKDVFARSIPVPRLRVGDAVVFAMAGAYAWNISHRDFLMHPTPTFHYLR